MRKAWCWRSLVVKHRRGKYSRKAAMRRVKVCPVSPNLRAISVVTICWILPFLTPIRLTEGVGKPRRAHAGTIAPLVGLRRLSRLRWRACGRTRHVERIQNAMRNLLLAVAAALTLSVANGCCCCHDFWYGHGNGCDDCNDQACGYCGPNCGACGPNGCQQGACQGGCQGNCQGGCCCDGRQACACCPAPDCATDRAAVASQLGGPAGPPCGQVTYPYYTTRGPRDYFAAHPPSIGP
jgi:hypothetical protein